MVFCAIDFKCFFWHRLSNRYERKTKWVKEAKMFGEPVCGEEKPMERADY